MKYLILRKPSRADEDPFTEMVSAGGGGNEFEFPFKVESRELDDREVDDVRNDPLVADMILSIPFTLIEPVPFEVSVAAQSPQVAWGVDAIGAGLSPFDGDGVTVAVLDTGIDKNHPAFSGVNLEEMDFTTNEEGEAGSAPDDHGHGTHCAATIFGREVDGKRIGVAPGIKRAFIGKVLGVNGGPTEAVYNAIEWALRRRADVVSMSLGINFPGVVTRLMQSGFPEDIATSRALEGYRSNIRLFDRLAALVAARVARGRGALLVAASGNESRRKEDARFTVGTAPPAAADGFVSVGAVSMAPDTTNPFVVAPFSNTGCLLSAPGVSILSAKRGGGLATMSGTSMATPHVSGVAALWTQKLFPQNDRPNGWAGDVLGAIRANVLKVPALSRNDVGLGIVQAPRE